MENKENIPNALQNPDLEIQKLTDSQNKDNALEKIVPEEIPKPVEDFTKLNEEAKVEIYKIESNIKNDTDHFNEVRAGLGMEPSEDIPSLNQSKEKLGILQVQQKSYESKILEDIKENVESADILEAKHELGNVENTGNVENIENVETKENIVVENVEEENTGKLEKREIESFEQMGQGFQNLARTLQERDNQGLTRFFDDSDIKDFSNFEKNLSSAESINDINQSIYKLNNVLEGALGYRVNGIRDNGDSLNEMSHTFSNLSSNLEEVSRKLGEKAIENKDYQDTIMMIRNTQESCDQFRSKVGRMQEFV